MDVDTLRGSTPIPPPVGLRLRLPSSPRGLGSPRLPRPTRFSDLPADVIERLPLDPELLARAVRRPVLEDRQKKAWFDSALHIHDMVKQRQAYKKLFEKLNLRDIHYLTAMGCHAAVHQEKLVFSEMLLATQQMLFRQAQGVLLILDSAPQMNTVLQILNGDKPAHQIIPMSQVEDLLKDFYSDLFASAIKITLCGGALFTRGVLYGEQVLLAALSHPHALPALADAMLGEPRTWTNLPGAAYFGETLVPIRDSLPRAEVETERFLHTVLAPASPFFLSFEKATPLHVEVALTALDLVGKAQQPAVQTAAFELMLRCWPRLDVSDPIAREVALGIDVQVRNRPQQVGLARAAWVGALEAASRPDLVLHQLGRWEYLLDASLLRPLQACLQKVVQPAAKMTYWKALDLVTRIGEAFPAQQRAVRQILYDCSANSPIRAAQDAALISLSLHVLSRNDLAHLRRLVYSSGELSRPIAEAVVTGLMCKLPAFAAGEAPPADFCEAWDFCIEVLISLNEPILNHYFVEQFLESEVADAYGILYFDRLADLLTRLPRLDVGALVTLRREHFFPNLGAQAAFLQRLPAAVHQQLLAVLRLDSASADAHMESVYITYKRFLTARFGAPFMVLLG
jgi:hypothetical protein